MCVYVAGSSRGGVLLRLEANRKVSSVCFAAFLVEITPFSRHARSRRYNLFVAVYGGYKGIPRHKDLVRPGMPVDGFAGLRARRESEIEPDYEHSPALNDPPDVTAAMEEDASLATSAPAATPSAATEVPPAEVAAVGQVSTST